MSVFPVLKSQTQETLASSYKQLNQQIVCRGCERVEFHVLTYQSHHPKPTQRTVYRPPKLQIHADFEELERCAKKFRCASCRIFRQVLLLGCNSSLAAESLVHSSKNRPVRASFEFLPGHGATEGGYVGPNVILEVSHLSLDGVVPMPLSLPPSADSESGQRNGHLTPQVRHWLLEGDGALWNTQTVPLMLSSSVSEPPLNLCSNPRAKAVLRQVRGWLTDCDRTHFDSCACLRYSSNNPTRLVHISDDCLRLVEPAMDRRLQYVALSYPWGDRTTMTEDEINTLQVSETTTLNLGARGQKINVRELTATVNDAISITRDIGVSYIWVDALCVVQDSDEDKNQEFPKMHEYYGNAYLTLCVSSTTKATEHFLGHRDAWSLNVQPCRLSGQWLVPSLELNTIRAAAPLSSRAWALQEERLSPRILYWTSHRLYWSCGAHELAEHEAGEQPVPMPPIDPIRRTDFAQSFLRCLVDGAESSQVNLHWRSMLESYTSRGISIPEDTFPALAGLAARYLYAQADTYLAGMWRKHIASGLAWTVNVPGNFTKTRLSTAPSWSWASLPTQIPTTMCEDSLAATHFEFLDYQQPASVGTSSSDPISIGAQVKRIHVRGRLRTFRPQDAIPQSWQTISRVLYNAEAFYFERPEQPVISADPIRELVLAYEARKKSVVGRLDYEGCAVRVADGDVVLVALEVRQNAMLLLEANEGGDGKEYSRVGAAKGYRSNFFEEAPVRDIWLA